MAPGRAFCGQSDAPVTENGQSPCIRPSGPYDIAAKPKNATDRNDVSTSGVAIFLNIDDIPIYYNSFALRRREFPTTDTLERAIANPAKTGERSHPKSG